MLLDKLNTESSEPACLEQNNTIVSFLGRRKWFQVEEWKWKKAWKVIDYKQVCQTKQILTA